MLMMRFQTTLVLFCVCLGLGCVWAKQSPHQKLHAAVPSKKTGSTVQRLPGSRLLSKWIREMKSSFSSDLEAILLQATRPSDGPVDLSLLDDLVHFVASEHQDAEILDNVVTKLSRKYAEEQPYTMLKSLLVLNFVVINVNERAGRAIADQYRVLKQQEDQKTNKQYFDDSHAKAASQQASNVAELHTVRVVRAYGDYLDKYLAAASAHKKSNRGTKRKAALKKAQSLGEIAVKIMQEVDTPLLAQCTEVIKKTLTRLNSEHSVAEASSARDSQTAPRHVNVEADGDTQETTEGDVDNGGEEEEDEELDEEHEADDGSS